MSNEIKNEDRLVCYPYRYGYLRSTLQNQTAELSRVLAEQGIVVDSTLQRALRESVKKVYENNMSALVENEIEHFGDEYGKRD